jgi:hypothetical protein
MWVRVVRLRNLEGLGKVNGPGSSRVAAVKRVGSMLRRWAPVLRSTGRVFMPASVRRLRLASTDSVSPAQGSEPPSLLQLPLLFEASPGDSCAPARFSPHARACRHAICRETSGPHLDSAVGPCKWKYSIMMQLRLVRKSWSGCRRRGAQPPSFGMGRRGVLGNRPSHRYCRGAWRPSRSHTLFHSLTFSLPPCFTLSVAVVCAWCVRWCCQRTRTRTHTSSCSLAHKSSVLAPDRNRA